MSDVSPLPYLDTKPVGAADFFTAINATFRFIERKLGRVGLLRYWQELGEKYYAPVAQRWAAGVEKSAGPRHAGEVPGPRIAGTTSEPPIALTPVDKFFPSIPSAGPSDLG
jgi:hypothetical protein